MFQATAPSNAQQTPTASGQAQQQQASPQQQQQQHQQQQQQQVVLLTNPWGIPTTFAQQPHLVHQQQHHHHQHHQHAFLQPAPPQNLALSLHMQIQSNPVFASHAQLQALLQTTTPEQLIQAILYIQQQQALAAAMLQQQIAQQQQQQQQLATASSQANGQFLMPANQPHVVYVTTPNAGGLQPPSNAQAPSGFGQQAPQAMSPSGAQAGQAQPAATASSVTPPTTSPHSRGAAGPTAGTATPHTSADAHDPPMPPAAPGDTEPGPRQLIVNYLPVDTTDDELQSLFTGIGPVEAARVIYDKATRRTKGFGFVYYKFHAHAVIAVRTLTGLQLRGKRLKVSYAVPQRPVSSLLTDDLPTPNATPNANGVAAPTQLTPHAISGASAPPSFDFVMPTSVKNQVAAARPAAMLNMAPAPTAAHDDQHNDTLPAAVVAALLEKTNEAAAAPPAQATGSSDTTQASLWLSGGSWDATPTPQ